MPQIRIKRPLPQTPVEAEAKLCLSRPDISAAPHGITGNHCQSVNCMAWVWDDRPENAGKGYCLLTLAALSVAERD